ncbi:hypothetical protein [Parasphingorhabdus sp.]|uniref:hypothetical protein n=1 Tax=Parasphingorhabdus sp. TaxID=2709688 RepID=UPI003BAFB720
MSAVKLTIRLNSSQFRTLNSLAEQRQIPRYRMLRRIINSGFSSTVGGASVQSDIHEIANEIAEYSARLAEMDRVLDRTLFTACAAYSYARNSALGMKRDDKKIAAEALAAFKRQRAIAEDGS